MLADCHGRITEGGLSGFHPAGETALEVFALGVLAMNREVVPLMACTQGPLTNNPATALNTDRPRALM